MAALGIVRLFFNDVEINLTPHSTSVSLGGVKNKETVYGVSVAPSGEMMPSMIEGEAVILTGDVVSSLYNTAQGEVQLHCDTGQVFTHPQAFITQAVTFSAGDGGKLKFRIACGALIEVTS